jgi:hypothetical protein
MRYAGKSLPMIGGMPTRVTLAQARLSTTSFRHHILSLHPFHLVQQLRLLLRSRWCLLPVHANFMSRGLRAVYLQALVTGTCF